MTNAVAAAVFLLGAVLLFVTAPHHGEFWWSDAPRHALNGVFVKDLIAAMPAHPGAWAMQYYVQYPALTILFYPPLFYAISAPFYALFGVSHATAIAVAAGGAIVAGMRARAQSSKRIQTPVLNIGYEESGQGFPGDPAARLSGRCTCLGGCRPSAGKSRISVLAPYLRGYGPTSFRDPNAPRMAEQAAIGQDVIDFADALGLARFALAGYDWGGRAACIAAALHPDRVRSGGAD